MDPEVTLIKINIFVRSYFFLLQSKKVAESLTNSNTIEEFNENYESILKLLDTYHNDLFLVRTTLTQKFEDNFKNTGIDFDSGSSDEDCYKSLKESGISQALVSQWASSRVFWRVLTHLSLS